MRLWLASTIVLLLAAAPPYIAKIVYCGGHQACCGAVVLAHEGHLAFK